MIKQRDENIFIKIIRFIKYNKVFTVIAIIVLLLLTYIFFSDKGFLARMKYQKEKERLEKQLAAEKNKQDSLRKVIDSLTNSDAMIEKIAREKYFMTKDGEIIYKVLNDTNKNK